MSTLFFFFSSRRRHTRCSRDWSSDVCSSDLPIWLYAMLRRPVYFAATEDLFRQPLLARVIRWFGAFPKRKNAAGDIGAMRSIFHLLKTGCLVGIYPEGMRTWDGTNGPIITDIGRIIPMI